MDNEVTTTSTVSGTATIRWRALPRRWVLLGVAGLLIAIAVLVPLALTMSRSALYAVAPNAQSGQDMDGSPQRSPDAPYATGESAGAGVAADVSEEPASAQPWDRMIIRTGTLQLTVKDIGDSIQRVRAASTASGGYVFSSETHSRRQLRPGLARATRPRRPGNEGC